jgi:predicted nucleic acid-binding protein
VPDLVIDASIALAWFLPDESSAYALTALAAVEQSTIHVPDLWAYEVANGLVIASRRKRIKPADVPVFAAALSRLRLHVARRDTKDILGNATISALNLGLTAYDGAYVDLALRQGIAMQRSTVVCARRPPPAWRFSLGNVRPTRNAHFAGLNSQAALPSP